MPAVPRLLLTQGLRVSEAIGADVEALGLERDHRTLTVLRKGGKGVTMPLAQRSLGPSIWRSANVSTDQSSSSSVGSVLTVTPPGGSCGASPAEAGSASGSVHTLRHAFITAASIPACRYAMSKRQRSAPIRTTMRSDRGRQSLEMTGTPHTFGATFIAGASR